MTLEEYLIDNPKKYLIFDLDGTLANLHIDWNTFRRDIFDYVATFDEPLTQTVPFVPFAGIGLSNKAAKKHGPTKAKEIRMFVEKYELSHYAGYSPNPDLLNFIHKNIQTYKFHLWTNNATETIQDFLIKESLTHSFTRIATQNDVLLIKPEIEGFSHIFQKGTLLSDYLLIGDSIYDEIAAKNAGIDFFKVDYFARQKPYRL